MITSTTDTRYLYRQYPEFVAACEQITRESIAEGDALRAQQNTTVSAMAKSHHDQGTPLPTLSELRRQHDEIWTTRNQRIEQVRKDMDVPLLQKWNQAIAVTGKATYHDVNPEEGRIRTVTLTETDNGVILNVHLAHAYSNERKAALLEAAEQFL
jgi:hypothetical protein